MDYLKAWPQYLLPHFWLCNIMYRLTRSRVQWWKNAFTGWFIKQYGVDMSEAQQTDPRGYEHFNAFFTRPLAEGARPVCDEPDAVICPVDGVISQLGFIHSQRLFQAKGKDYTLRELIGGEPQWVDEFTDGEFLTMYLSPKDYHRIHMPWHGQAKHMVHLPGRLFSVSPATTRAIPNLFARNERVVVYFDNPNCGPFIMVLVGALFVGSIETVWEGVITPPHGNRVNRWDYTANPIELSRGSEMGRFNMGSTVILLFPRGAASWSDTLHAGGKVQMGQKFGVMIRR
jgi:phosphatidylserine decarboxylase